MQQKLNSGQGDPNRIAARQEWLSRQPQQQQQPQRPQPMQKQPFQQGQPDYQQPMQNPFNGGNFVNYPNFESNMWNGMQQQPMYNQPSQFAQNKLPQAQQQPDFSNIMTAQPYFKR
jgi:hypothetical protein